MSFIQVERIGQIPTPIQARTQTPEEFAQGHNTVEMVFERPVTLTVDWTTRVHYPVGTHDVPAHLEDHWYLQANGVERYSRPIAINGTKSK